MTAIRLVPNTNLRVGMTVLHPLKITPDVKLVRVFKTSPKFPHIAFETDRHTKVVFSPCGKSYVTF